MGDVDSAPTLIQLQWLLLSLRVDEVQFVCWDMLTFSRGATCWKSGRRVARKSCCSLSVCASFLLV